MSVMKRLRALFPYVLPRRHRLRNGIALGAPGRDAMLETLCVVAIVGLLLAVTVPSYIPMLKRFMLTEAASLTVGYKVRIAEALAVRGAMPEMLEPSEVATPTRSQYFDEFAWQDGEIVFTLGARTSVGMLPEAAIASAPPLTLSFRFARSATGNRLVLLCGLAEAPPGFTAAPARHTTVPAAFLPAHCRI
jgi:type II secretory pathway pseudopilin PulG